MELTNINSDRRLAMHQAVNPTVSPAVSPIVSPTVSPTVSHSVNHLDNHPDNHAVMSQVAIDQPTGNWGRQVVMNCARLESAVRLTKAVHSTKKGQFLKMRFLMRCLVIGLLLIL